MTARTYGPSSITTTCRTPLAKPRRWARLIDGWALNGITVLQSGQPYDGYDFSGAVGGIYYANFVEILDPVMPIKPGITVKQVELQGTTGIDPNKPLLNAADFYVPQIPAGRWASPAGDNLETSFGATGRNIFRGPFQERFDISAVKVTKINERVSLKFQMDVSTSSTVPASMSRSTTSASTA